MVLDEKVCTVYETLTTTLQYLTSQFDPVKDNELKKLKCVGENCKNY